MLCFYLGPIGLTGAEGVVEVVEARSGPSSSFQTVSNGRYPSTSIVRTISQPPLCLCTTPQDVAAYIKKEFDKKYNPTWHCIVGRNFGSYVTHETKHFIYFYLGQVAVLLFKSG